MIFLSKYWQPVGSLFIFSSDFKIFLVIVNYCKKNNFSLCAIVRLHLQNQKNSKCTFFCILESHLIGGLFNN